MSSIISDKMKKSIIGLVNELIDKKPYGYQIIIPLHSLLQRLSVIIVCMFVGFWVSVQKACIIYLLVNSKLFLKISDFVEFIDRSELASSNLIIEEINYLEQS